jgi:hypothetical protein
MVIIQARTHDYYSYIREQPSSWGTSRICPSWPRSRLRLSLLLVSLSKFLVCHGSSSILLFVSTDRVSHPTPSLRSRRLLTNVQVNNITTLHDTHIYTYIHHTGITILLPFYTSSTLLGRPAGPDPSRLTPYSGVHSLVICTSCILRSPTCQASQQENTSWAKYQKADRTSTLCTLWCTYSVAIYVRTVVLPLQSHRMFCCNYNR